MKLLSQGAEARVYITEGDPDGDNFTHRFNVGNLEYTIQTKYRYIIWKYRFPRRYRHPIIDQEFRKIRTRREFKIIEKLSNVINVPEIVFIDENNGILAMQFIEGENLKLYIDRTKNIDIFGDIGKIVALLHKNNVIHGDLTTNNFILKDNRIFVIDFGLSFHSTKIEDFATDLHLLKEVIFSRHWYIAEEAWKTLLSNYSNTFPEKSQLIISRLNKIESRGRYK